VAFQKGNKYGTRFQPGNNANPGGRPKKLPFTDILRKLSEDPELVEKYGRAAFKHAILGSSAHFKEINERVEGKVKDESEVTGKITIQFIRDPETPQVGIPSKPEEN
jgi:hypothetical protein